jgi:hypothetical protein
MAVILTAAALLLIVAPVATPTAGSGTAAAAPDPLTCSGYPEHRIFLESQTWWLTTPGLTGTDFGHMHVGACLPDRQHVSGVIGIDVRIILHDNPGTFDYFNPVLVSDTQEISLPHVPILGLTCPVGTCARFAHVDVDTSLLDFDGYQEIRIRAYTNTPDGNIMHSSINALPYVANGKTVDDLDRRAYERGKGWYTGSGYCEASFVSVIPTDPISGTWTPTVKIENHGDTDDLPVTHHTIRIDPDFHAIPPVPGTIIVDGPGQLLQTTLSPHAGGLRRPARIDELWRAGSHVQCRQRRFPTAAGRLHGVGVSAEPVREAGPSYELHDPHLSDELRVVGGPERRRATGRGGWGVQ